MEMKHYKDANDKTYGFAADGSQDHLKPEGLIEISKAECDRLGILNYQKQLESEIASMDYVRQRITEYPMVSDFLDAWVKGDEQAMEEYRQACLAVKAKYPKPAGF
jgi:hypothetical protein